MPSGRQLCEKPLKVKTKKAKMIRADFFTIDYFGVMNETITGMAKSIKNPQLRSILSGWSFLYIIAQIYEKI